MKFHCNPGFMMKGQPIMTCSEAVDNGESFGKWIGEVQIAFEILKMKYFKKKKCEFGSRVI